MAQVLKPCCVPGCQRPRPAGLRASFTPGLRARQVKVPVCPWCLVGRTPESQDLQMFQGRSPSEALQKRLEAWMAIGGYDFRVPPPPGSGQVGINLSAVVVDVDLDLERTPFEALQDGLIQFRARGRGYEATEKGRAAIAQLRRRNLGARRIQRRVGLGKATVVSIIQQLEAGP